MDIESSWTYIEDNREHEVTEKEYYRHLIRKIPEILNSEDMDRVLSFLWDLEEFVDGATSELHKEKISRFTPVIREKIHRSNTPAQRYLLWVESLDREEEEEEETLEEQRDRIWQEAIRLADLEVDDSRTASPAA